MQDAEIAAEFVAIGRFDWFVTRSWNRLHWASLSEEQQSDIPAMWAVEGPVRLACGRTAAYLSIPGMFSRMGAMRCTGCCRALGYPPGKGSPKNDDACRAMLGLD